ncbi:TetR/AcrR family transcriptional regulator [Patulibacter sp. S7RM1-6]
MHDVSGPQATTPTGRPQTERLSRALVIDAATTIARRDGLDALSMRRLAEELGVSTMAAYRHVAGKETLVDDVLEAAVGEIDLDTGDGAWEERLATIVTRSYEAFLTVPGLAEHLHGRALSRPAIVRWLEALNAPLVEAGIAADQRATFTPAVLWLLRGATRLEAEWSETLRALEEIAEAGPEDAPSMRAARENFGEHEPADFLRNGLDLLVGGLRAFATA